MKVAIYGAGSLGTVLGAYISKAGIEIDLISRNKNHIEALSEKGANIIGKHEFNTKVNALTPDKMNKKYDIIFLMTKQLDNKKVIQFLNNYIDSDGVICTMQNGLPELSVAEVIGEDRTFGCAIGWGAQLTEPGVSMLTSDPDAIVFALGALTKKGRSTQHFREVVELLSLAGKVEVEDNFIGVRWSKLIVNSSFSGMGTVIGGTFGDVSDNKFARKCAQHIIKEIIEVSRKSNIEIAKIQGKDIVKLLDYNNRFKQKVSFAIIPIAIKKHRDIKPSMLQDIENNKATEVDAINGIVSEVGRKVGVITPINDMVVKIIKSIENGEKKPSVDNLNEFKNLL